MRDVVTADGPLLIDRALARAIASLLDRDAETADYARELRALLQQPAAPQVPEGQTFPPAPETPFRDGKSGMPLYDTMHLHLYALACADTWATPPAPEQPACTQRGECDCIGQCKNGRGGNGAEQPKPAGDDLLAWAVSRWNAEVSQRPLENRHRRSLDDAWRQVIRYAGGDDVVLCGPRHDELLAAQPAQGEAEK